MIKTVTFHGQVGSLGEVTLTSPRITTPFATVDITASYPPGCVNLVRLKFFISYDDSEPVTGEPDGMSLLRDYGHVDYIVGDNQQKYLTHNVTIKESGAYIKVYAKNYDTDPHAVDVQVSIEVSERS